MSTAITGCFLGRARRTTRSRPRPRRSSRSASPARTRPRSAKGPGSFHVALYDALYDLDPATLDSRAKLSVRLHAIVEDLATARAAVEGGATVVQLRLQGASTGRAGRGRPRASASSPATLRRERRRRGGARARARTASTSAAQTRAPSERARPGCSSGRRRPQSPRRATAERQGAAYVGAGPVWATPSKPDADPPIGLDGLARDLPRGLDPGRRDRRRRRLATRATASTRARPAWPCPGRGRRTGAAGGGRCGSLSSASSGCWPSWNGVASRSGIENDAAELGGGLVVTQDALVEGVHFRLDWTSYRELGYRAAAVNLSDLAASGAEPQALLVTLARAGRARARGRARALRRPERARRRRSPAATRARADSSCSARDRARPLGARARPSRGPTGRPRSSSPARSAPRVRPSGRAVTPGRRFGSRKAAVSPPSPMR